MRESHFEVDGPGEKVRLAYTEWGDAANPDVVFCVHGLTRNGHDFDDLAAALAPRWRVICPDVVGRGRSQHFADKSLYANPTYVQHLLALIRHLGLAKVDWVGTSMGGILGMLTAAMPETPIRRLVVNDIGPFIPKAAIDGLAQVVSNRPTFKSFPAAVAYVAEAMQGFGRLPIEKWQGMTRSSYRENANGEWELIYDRGAVQAMIEGPRKDTEFWPVWDAIQVPVLLLRGQLSDLLLAETAQQMTTRGPKTDLVVIPDVGHAPALMDPYQVGLVAHWLATRR
jgi:pimeloyl-ACP methyl ester carboxylesterase